MREAPGVHRALPPLAYPAELPISARRAELVALLRAHPVVVVCGETGSGKTTQLPKLLLEAGALAQGLIGHTQPRRIAARAVAARLTAELKGASAGFVGCKVRFSDRTGPATAIKLMTDGILLAEARHDRRLARYDALIIDEAHERSLNIDFLLGCLRQLLPRRPELKLVITSATIDPERFAKYFGGAPIVEVSGRAFPVETRYRPLDQDADDRYDPGLTAGILAALEELEREPGAGGDVLVFLPGEREIRETGEAIQQAYGPRFEVLPLYSRLAFAEQQRVFEPQGRPRVVLATNAAETSLTVPGIRAVIDSGLARLARYSARAKILRLPIEPISQASADQRRGRCGRVGPGLCLRLYAEDDYAARPAFTPPEVLRTNLASVILQMEVLGLGAPAEFPFLDPPETRLISDGYRLLHELGAVDGERRVTAIGRTLARLPVDPRLGRMLLEGARRGALAELLVLAAGLSLQDPRERPGAAQAAADAAHAQAADPRSDFLSLLSLWHRYQAERATATRSGLKRWCAAQFLSAARMREWEDLHAQLGDIAAELGWRAAAEPPSPQTLHRALLTGLLGSIGERSERGDYLGPRGLRFAIAPGTPLRAHPPRWLMAASLLETQRVYARIVAAIEPAWIETAAPHLVKRSHSEPDWDSGRGTVTARESVSLYGLTLVSGRRVNFGRVAPEAAREIFVREALVHGRCRLRARFLEHNAALRERLSEEQAALRRPVVLVGEEAEAAFYLARVPAGVNTLAAFERWRLLAERERPELLHMQEPDLRRADAPPLDRDRYPLTLRIAGNALPVSYRFEPGAADDGATLLVPAPLVPKLEPAELAWGIPGWLEERVTALIRGLPKPLRRELVPAPDAARSAVAELGPAFGAGPFHTRLAASLTRLAGAPVPAAALAAVPLEPWLRLNLRVVDAAGQVLAAGRELEALRRAARAASGVESAGRADDPWNRPVVKSFDIEALPEVVVVSVQGVELQLHPALLDRGTHAALTLLADARAAERETRLGLVRLASLKLAAQLRTAGERLGQDRELVLLHRTLGPVDDFVRAVGERALARLLLPEATPLPRTRVAFGAALERVRPDLVECAERLGRTLTQVLREHFKVAAALKALPPGLEPELRADLAAQLAGLVHPGFVAATPDPWLESLPRYLTALGRRAARLPGASRAQLAAQWTLVAARRRLAPLPTAAAAELRWLVEEYSVQLFAQDLGTRVPVSQKRLEAAFAAAEAAESATGQC